MDRTGLSNAEQAGAPGRVRTPATESIQPYCNSRVRTKPGGDGTVTLGDEIMLAHGACVDGPAKIGCATAVSEHNATSSASTVTSTAQRSSTTPWSCISRASTRASSLNMAWRTVRRALSRRGDKPDTCALKQSTPRLPLAPRAAAWIFRRTADAVSAWSVP